MTLDKLQKEMIVAMKNGDKFRKNVISMIIAQIKRSAIDKGVRDNITEELVNAELLKYQKAVKETIEALPPTDPRKAEANVELVIVNEFAPTLINNADRILEIIRDEYEGPLNKKDLMKFFSGNYKGKVDMKIVNQIVSEVVAS